jgi:Tol biopolymer transport system component
VIVVATVFAACGSSDRVTRPSEPFGRLVIRATTSGESRDVAYLAFVDSEPARLLMADSFLQFDSLAPGQHRLRLSGVAPNCSLGGAANRTLTITSDASLIDSVEVACESVAPRILYGSSRDGDYDLYVANADGSGPTRITTASAYHGQWSPDGSHLVYMSPRSGYHQIYVSDTNGLNEIQLTSDSAAHDYPRWSPDGSRIAFTKDQSTWVMNADGSDAHLVLASSFVDAVSWSPDGNQIAFGGLEVFVMNADGTHYHALTYTPNHNSTAPVWSPDGTRIAFITNRDSAASDIYVMNADGTNQIALTHSPYGVANEQIAWSPDGTRLAFRSNQPDSHPNIYTMNVDGTDVTDITHSIGDNFGPAWHP